MTNNKTHLPKACLDKCSRCGTNPARPEHFCPMETEEETTCDCCRECIKDCVDRPKNP